MKYLFVSILLLACPAGSYAYPQPNTLYNEGLVYYQQGDKGRAAQSLKKALLLKPSLEEARTLYNTIQNETGGVGLSENRTALWFLKIFDFLPPQGDALCAAVLFFGASFLSALFFLGRIPKKKMFPWAVALFILSAGLSLQAYIKYSLIFQRDIRIGLEPSALLDEPSPEGRALAEFPAGSEFTALEEADGYVLLRSHNNIQGWASAALAPRLWEKP